MAAMDENITLDMFIIQPSEETSAFLLRRWSENPLIFRSDTYVAFSESCSLRFYRRVMDSTRSNYTFYELCEAVRDLMEPAAHFLKKQTNHTFLTVLFSICV